MRDQLGSRRYERNLDQGLEGKYVAVARFIPSGRRILELGASSGYFSRILIAAGHSVVVFEIDPSCVEIARLNGLEAHVVDLNQRFPAELLSDRKVNVVLLMDVLEHLVEPGRLLVRLREALGNDFILIVTGPNVAYWWVRLSLLFGRWNYAETGIMDKTHLRWLTLRTWCQLIEGAGYSVSVATAAEGMFPKEQWLRRIGFCQKSVDRLRKLLMRLFPELFGTVLLFVAKPV